jgi:hypothetical protein
MQVGYHHYYMTITNTTRPSPRLGYTQQTSLLVHLTHRITARNVLGLVQVEDLHDSWGYVARFISPLALVSPDYSPVPQVLIVEISARNAMLSLGRLIVLINTLEEDSRFP